MAQAVFTAFLWLVCTAAPYHAFRYGCVLVTFHGYLLCENKDQEGECHEQSFSWLIYADSDSSSRPRTLWCSVYLGQNLLQVY